MRKFGKTARCSGYINHIEPSTGNARKVNGLSGIIKALCFCVLASALLSSCGKNPETATRYSPAEIAQAIISNQSDISMLQPLFPDDDYFAEYISNIYRIDADAIEDGAIYYSSGMRANEIAVFLLADSSDINEVNAELLNYKERRADAFTGYAPDQASILENGIIVTCGDYTALLICEQPQTAKTAFMACFSAEPPLIDYGNELLFPKNGTEPAANEPDADEIGPPAKIGFAADEGEPHSEPDYLKTEDYTEADETPAGDEAESEGEVGNDDKISDETVETPDADETDGETQISPASKNPASDGEAAANPVENWEKAHQEDVYDPAAILEAWRDGNMTNLSYKNKSILEACIYVIDALINENMSDYEKELIINDWIVDWVSYDEDAGSNSPNASPDPDNDNPYGALYRQKAICSGYTSTFQLFMDMLGIECITVNGTYARTGEDHAWNMVRIEGEWYCVDVTWNDPIGVYIPATAKHEYFNVTSRFMLETRHQWDESTTPTADAGKLYRG